MNNLLAFPARKRKTGIDAATRLRIRVPHDETGPLVIEIPEETAAAIRRDALKFGKTPDEFLTIWLNAGFNFPGAA